jgi:hypothetical protein
LTRGAPRRTRLVATIQEPPLRQPLALALAALSLAAAGCAARMKLAPALEEGAEGWSVKVGASRGWDTRLAFGPWQCAAAAAKGWSLDVLGVTGKAAAAARPHALRLEGPAGTIEAECLQQRLAAVAPFGVELDLEKLGGQPALACAFRPSGSTGWTGVWTLLLRATGQPTQAYEGELRDARGVSFSVRSVHVLSTGAITPGAPIGYALDREGTPAAAVEMLESSRVLVSRRESEAAALSAAAAALLLFTP